ncbi:MAG: sodium:calcium antiporter [Candidatus Bathyarchaeota archaeon]|nr:MAG: sodium:calcium antiporter [Candidatus Bathyarchaeota archaeon]
MTEFAFQLAVLVASLSGLAIISHFTIKWVEKVIELTGLSEVSAGFIILSVMTSTPEIMVALFAVLQGDPGISVGDILGSNVFNMGTVLGILGLLGYLQMCCTEVLIELTDILFLTSLIPLLLIISHFHIFDISSPIVGLILLATFVVNVFLVARKRTPPIEPDPSEKVGKGRMKIVLGKLVLGFAIIAVTARLVVGASSDIASALGAPPILIGAAIVSVGTSLPELTTSLAAARREHVQLAIGDIIGSNLTNLTLVLGIVLLTSPAVDMTIFSEILPFLLITTVIFWRFLMRGGVSKIGGLILLIMYILFQVVTIQI